MEAWEGGKINSAANNEAKNRFSVMMNSPDLNPPGAPSVLSPIPWAGDEPAFVEQGTFQAPHLAREALGLGITIIRTAGRITTRG
jgi:hypothetical protein